MTGYTDCVVVRNNVGYIQWISRSGQPWLIVGRQSDPRWSDFADSFEDSSLLWVEHANEFRLEDFV